MSNAKLGFGTLLSKGGVYIGEINKLTPPKMSAGSVDVTTMDSADGYKEFIQGLRDGGSIGIEGNLYTGSAGQMALITDFNAGTASEYIITFPAAIGATWTFTAFVTDFEGDSPIDNAVGFKASLKITGKPVLGTTAATGISALTIRDQDDTAEATAANYLPTFAIGTYFYAVTYTTATGFRVRATMSASHTAKMYVDGVFLETLVSGSSSSSVTVAADGSKHVQLIVESAGKTPLTYNLTVARIS